MSEADGLSSLSQQLSQLGGGSTVDRTWKLKQHSKSLIYEPQVAQDQDFSFIHAVGVEGLRDLVSLDSRFAQFENNLFSDTSIDIDRYVQTQDQNDQLDKAIDAFLALIGPYLMLTPAVKALEWLVRRFHINQMNAEQLLLCVLPYYDQDIYLRVADVIIKLPPLFVFLNKSKSTAQNPPRNLLIRAFSADMRLFELVTEYIVGQTTTKTSYQRQLSFWSQFAIYGLVADKADPERMLEIYLPALAKLVVTTDTDCQIAAYMVLTVLGNKMPLNKEVFNALVETIAANWTQKAVKSGILCITQMYQQKQEPEMLPASVMTALNKAGFQPSDVVALSQKYKMALFTLGYCMALLQNPDASNLKGLEEIISNTQFGANESAFIMRYIVDWALAKETTTSVAALAAPVIAKWVTRGETVPELDQLELKLQTVFTEAAVEEMEVEEIQEDVDIESLVQQAKKTASQTATYFTTKSSDNYAELSKIFVQLIERGYTMDKFVGMFSSDIASLTFFARIWSSPSPLLARLAAVEAAKTVLSAAGDADFQNLIPYTCIALSDASERVRKAAAGFAEVLKSKQNKKPIWGVEKIYTNDCSYLGSGDVTVLLNALSLEECILDESFVIRQVSDMISKKKGHKSAFSTAVLAYLGSHAVSQEIIPVRTSLLTLVTSSEEPIVPTTKVVEPLYTNPPNDLAYITELIRTVTDKTGIKFLESLIKNDSPIYDEVCDVVTQRLVKLWPTLKGDAHLGLCRFFVDLSLDKDVPFDSLDVLAHVDVPTKVFISLLDDCKVEQNTTSMEAPSDESAKRRRRSSSSTVRNLLQGKLHHIAERNLRKVSLVLELLVASKTTDDALLGPLFAQLGEILTLGTDSNLPIDYCQSLLADVLLNIIRANQHDGANIDRDIRVDIVVSAIRTASNAQIQNKYLLLVAELATVAPTLVLHSVMPIFTFMGANTLRQDDDFSVHVIEQTVARIVPCLAGNTDKVDMLLVSFVTAFPHIPQHRRVKLFGELVRALDASGSKDALATLLFLFAQKSAELKAARKTSEVAATAKFCDSLFKLFDASKQLAVVLPYINLVKELYAIIATDPKTKEKEKKTRRQIFLQVDKEPEVSPIDFLVALLETRVLPLQAGLVQNPEALKIAENVLTVLIESTYPELLNVILSLLPLPLFVTVAGRLGSSVYKTVLARFTSGSIEEEDTKAADTLLESLHKLLKSTTDTGDLVLLLQTVETVAAGFPKCSDALLVTCAGDAVAQLKNSDDDVFIQAVSVLSSLCLRLGARMIGLFPSTIASVLSRDSSDNLIALSVLALFATFIKRLPSFMVSSLPKIFEFALKCPADTETRKQLFIVCVETMDSRVVLQTLCDSWKFVEGFENARLFADTLDLAVAEADKKQIHSKADNLITLCLEAFDSSLELETNTAARVQNLFIKCLIAIVLKLNDKTFRPLFVKIVDWNTPERSTLLFKIVCRLQENLKSIVTSYFGYIIDLALDILNKASTITPALQRNILSSLYSSFRFDREEFWNNEERFTKISEALGAQFPYLTKIAPENSKLLIKAVVALCELASEDQKKQLNDMMIKLLRQAPLYGSRCFAALFNNVGEEFLPFLPQLVPQIAELLESEDEKVESAVRAELIPAVEEVLGESLDRYLA
ncbi:U3 small nucleolar RNA-associated protein 10 [Yarrowia sp. C11]|nr:U3 small nucleolar RNA-associated protein 10 [Yarrowia sp. C11]